MYKFIDFHDFEVRFITEKSRNIRKLHHFIFGNQGHRKICRFIQFTGFPSETKSDEYEDKIHQIKDSFSINELITI